MADAKKYSYAVVQEGRDGAPIDIFGGNYQRGDTIWLTQDDAKYLIGLSIEPTAETNALLNGGTPVGEHRESGVDVEEDTRQFQQPQAKSEDDREERRPARSAVKRG